eukprot:5905335-Prymnesium_polylepis.1
MAGETAISKAVQEMGARPPPPLGGEGTPRRAPSAKALPLPPPPALKASSRPLPKWAGCKPAVGTFVNYEEAEGAPSFFDSLAAADVDGARRREFIVNLAVNHSVLLETVHGREELSA